MLFHVLVVTTFVRKLSCVTNRIPLRPTTLVFNLAMKLPGIHNHYGPKITFEFIGRNKAFELA